MHLPLRIEVAPAGTAIELVSQELFIVPKEDKPSLLQSLLTEHHGSILVFSRTKFGAKKIAQTIRNSGHTASEIHSNRSLNQRLEALEGFKIGRYRVLVATDIAARGIDVTGIQLVVNYDLPSTAEDYVHRIGRTGRAGLAGKAISFATPDQRFEVRSIERLIRANLPVSKLPLLPKMPKPQKDFNDDKYADRSRRPSHGGGSRGPKPFGRSSHSPSSRPFRGDRDSRAPQGPRHGYARKFSAPAKKQTPWS